MGGNAGTRAKTTFRNHYCSGLSRTSALTAFGKAEPSPEQEPLPLDKPLGPKQLQNIGDGSFSMPLTRGRILGYDAKRMAFQFTMLNEGETVESPISGAAMDELSGKRGTLPVEREAQFLLLRDAIERIASHNFDSESPV